jgi:hypothetical protein
MPGRNDTPHHDEQRFCELTDRLRHSTDRTEQERLKAALVQTLLHGQPGGQQYAMREFASRMR